MIKFLVGLLIVALLAVVGYYRFTPEPLSPRASIDAGIQQAKEKTALTPEQEMLLKVQLAISDYMAANGTAPASLADLVPKYFDTEPRNPVTNEAFPYRREGKMPKLGAQIAKAEPGKGDKPGQKKPEEGDIGLVSTDGFVNPNTMQLDDFTYDKNGKRDPFEPFDLSATPEPVGGSSLTAYSLGQLRLTAVIVAPSGEKKGIVEDTQGRGYTVTEGTQIGNDGGVVVSIEADRLKIVVTKTDFTGQTTQNAVEMKINQAGPSGQNKKKEPKK